LPWSDGAKFAQLACAAIIRSFASASSIVVDLVDLSQRQVVLLGAAP